MPRVFRSRKPFLLAAVLIPALGSECDECAGQVAEQLAQTPAVSASIGMLPGLEMAARVAELRHQTGCCPASAKAFVASFDAEGQQKVATDLARFA